MFEFVQVFILKSRKTHILHLKCKVLLERADIIELDKTFWEM